VNKFRILSGKLGGSIDRVSDILNACAHLNNFITQEDRQFHMEYILATVGEEMKALFACCPG